MAPQTTMLKVSSTVDVTRSQPMYAIITRKMLGGIVPETEKNVLDYVWNYEYNESYESYVKLMMRV